VHPKLFLSLWYVRRKPCTYLALRLALSPNVPKELPLEPHHLAVPSGVYKTIPKTIVRSAQTILLSFTDTNTVFNTDQNKILHGPCYLGVPPSASKMISGHVVCLAQNVHLSYVTISTIPKQTKMSFHLSLVT
jgi:hypothetical protein